VKDRRIPRFDASIFLLLAIVLILVVSVVFILVTLRQDPIEEALSGDRVVNTLFVLENQGKPLASYVLMYYPGTKKAAIFDVPGEIGLIIRHIDRVDRIDTVYNTQKLSLYEGEIESLLGIDINFTVVFNLDSLGRVVDLLEGVEIFIPSPVAVYDPELPVFFPSGIRRLDGDKVKSFITYKLPDEEDDLVTFRRQRFFLGFLKRLGEMDGNLKKPDLALVFQNQVRFSANARTQGRLFSELAGIDTDRVSIQSVGGTRREVSGQTLIFPYYNGSLIKDIVRESLGGLTRQTDGSITDRVLTVEVLNGTTVVGLAGRTAELLRGFGYDVITIGNADRSDQELTQVIDRSGYEDLARAFADIIHCDTIIYESPIQELLEPGLETNLQNYEYRSDFTLVIGRDFNGRYVAE
jgi:anionic cell wall polymer biosynthesis LytR-Cps2A-Psr (LCP) family protein